MNDSHTQKDARNGVVSGDWLAVPKDWRTHYRGKGCQCAAYDRSECGCDADWTDPEIYRLRNTINELIQCVTTDHESKADFIARVNAILSANVEISHARERRTGLYFSENIVDISGPRPLPPLHTL